MSENYFHINERAIERVAEVAASSVPGTLELDAKLAGLAGRSFPRIDVHLDRHSGVAAIEAEIATSYPAPIAAVTDAVRATIISHVRTLTGIDVSRVNIHVANVQAGEHARRVTWDDVASHSAFIIPTAMQVHPSEVRSPETKERSPLAPIHARSLTEDLREVTTPDPITVSSVDTPKPSPVKTSGFNVQAPHVYSPEVPAVRRLASISASPTGVSSVQLPPQRPLKNISVQRPTLTPVTIRRSQQPAHIQAPQPKPVLRPQAPRPQPLRQITIEPVVKYYDRS